MPPRKWQIRYLRLVRRAHRILRHRQLRHRLWWQPISRRLLDRRLWQPCRDTVAGGISLGLFFAMMPMPMQTLASAAVATRARVNIPFAVGVCFVSNPLTEPFIRITQLRFGGWLRDNLGIAPPQVGDLAMHPGVADFILGFLVSGLLLSLAAYPLVHLFSALLPDKLPAIPIKRPLHRRRSKPARESG